VFLPGIIAPAAIRYAPLVSCLADVETVTKDLAVYATGTPPPGYSIAMEVAGIDRAADAARFDRFHLYGHSAGGAVALAYVAAHPDRVISLTIDEPADDFAEAGRVDLREFEPLATLPVPERLQAFMRLQVSPVVVLPPPPPGPPPPWMTSRPGGIEAFIAALKRHERLTERYSMFRAPVLFTWGSLTHPRWDRMRLRLAMAFSDFTAERFNGLHHLNTSHQAEPDRVARLLQDLWTRAEQVA
ncbi:MAG: alpha/beta fold hydrolase, partial [Vicinamibacterales bacterium]